MSHLLQEGDTAYSLPQSLQLDVVDRLSCAVLDANADGNNTIRLKSISATQRSVGYKAVHPMPHLLPALIHAGHARGLR